VHRPIIAVMALLTAAACGGRAAPSASAPSHGSTAAVSSPLRPSHEARAVTMRHPRSPSAAIRHVFLIVLENESYANSYQHNPNHYLGKVLQRQGTLLTQYYATGHVSLDNYIAMISGQAPNPATSSDCQKYTNFNGTTNPATLNSDGQAVGVGCVYPSNVKTLADQLSNQHISWSGYMEDMGNARSREQHRCGTPSASSNGLDDTQQATAKDQYAARHNPFVYFHSLVDSGLCRRHVVSLPHLRTALHHAKTTPRFAFITPDLCDDGHDSPCAGKDARGSKAGGLKSVDHFLSKWIPRIKHSSAFRRNGLIIITSDESETSDASSCCNEKPGPTDPMPGISGPGGGRVGTLVIGHCVRHGAHDSKPYNHYSLLRSLERLFEIHDGGSDGNGHLGYAGAAGLRPFGNDLFAHCRG
jgi:phosphatidylinositol-3-phosphatase